MTSVVPPSAISRPSWSRIASVQKLSMVLMPWETSRMVVPESRSSYIFCSAASLVTASPAARVSSRIRTSGSTLIATAKPSLERIPLE